MPVSPRRSDSCRAGIVSVTALSRLRKQWRRQGLKLVFTNGVFDLLHRGHLDLLTKAKSWGDVLIVGINTDASVRRIKGPSRPVNRQRDRAALVAALHPVDAVCLFAESTPLQLIRRLRPDVLVKGGEYKVDEIVGSELVRGWGGSVRRIRMRPDYSTSRLLGKLATPRVRKPIRHK